MWLRGCFRQVEAEVIINSRNKLHQTTYEDFFLSSVGRIFLPFEDHNFSLVPACHFQLTTAIGHVPSLSGGNCNLCKDGGRRIDEVRQADFLYSVQGSAERWFPGCVNAAGKARQRW